MRLRFPWAIAVASIAGCAVFIALLPWGDQAVPGFLGHLRNAVFFVICLLIGFVAGFITHSRRYLAGALSTPASAILAIIAAHFVYGGTIHWDAPHFYRTTALVFAGLALLGALGAAASRWSPNNRWRGP